MMDDGQVGVGAVSPAGSALGDSGASSKPCRPLPEFDLCSLRSLCIREKCVAKVLPQCAHNQLTSLLFLAFNARQCSENSCRVPYDSLRREMTKCKGRERESKGVLKRQLPVECHCLKDAVDRIIDLLLHCLDLCFMASFRLCT